MTDIEYIKKYIEPDKLEEGLKRLENGEPVQYIVGNVDFYGYTYKVNKNVLIPRFETEELVSKTLEYINEYLSNNVNILDIGTGSGCIAITLKNKLPLSNIEAIDISKEALEVAKENAVLNNAEVTFYESNIFSKVKRKYDVIISNPPYIKYDEKIMEIVKNNEPHLALYAKNDGLYFYEQILEKAIDYLNEKFIISFEIGSTQSSSVEVLARKYFKNCDIFTLKDLTNVDRYVFIIKK